MLVVLIITTSIFYFYTSSIIKDQTVASLDDFSNTLITKVDSKLEPPLNQITNRLILSYPQINEQFESYRSSSDKPIEQFYINQSLQELLLAIGGGSPFNYYQISIYQPMALLHIMVDKPILKRLLQTLLLEHLT